MTSQRAFYSALGVSKYVGVSKATVYRALRNDGTDPHAFPPPLEYVGRKGEGGAYVISHAQLVAWVESWSRFG